MTHPWALAAIFGQSLAIAFSGALMPGPMLVVTAIHAHRRGWTAGPLVVLGHGWLELLLICAAILGLGPYLGHPTVMGALGLAGGAVLAVMGVSMLRASRTIELADPATETPDDAEGTPSGGKSAPGPGLHRGAFVAGVWSSLVNPYWSIWWLFIGLGLIASSTTAGMAGLAVFFIGHILADLIWFTFVSVALSRGKAIIPRGVFRGLVVAGALVLLYMAASFAWFGAGALRSGSYDAPEPAAERPSE